MSSNLRPKLPLDLAFVSNIGASSVLQSTAFPQQYALVSSRTLRHCRASKMTVLDSNTGSEAEEERIYSDKNVSSTRSLSVSDATVNPRLSLLTSPAVVLALPAASAALFQRFVATIEPSQMLARIRLRTREIVDERQTRARLRDARAQVIMLQSDPSALDALSNRLEHEFLDVEARIAVAQAQLSEIRETRSQFEYALQLGTATENKLLACADELSCNRVATDKLTRDMTDADLAVAEKRSKVVQLKQLLDQLQYRVLAEEEQSQVERIKASDARKHIEEDIQSAAHELQEITSSNQKKSQELHMVHSLKVQTAQAALENVTFAVEAAKKDLSRPHARLEKKISTETDLANILDMIKCVKAHLSDLDEYDLEEQRLRIELQRKETQLTAIRKELALAYSQGGQLRPLEFDLSRHLSAPLPALRTDLHFKARHDEKAIPNNLAENDPIDYNLQSPPYTPQIMNGGDLNADIALAGYGQQDEVIVPIPEPSASPQVWKSDVVDLDSANPKSYIMERHTRSLFDDTAASDYNTASDDTAASRESHTVLAQFLSVDEHRKDKISADPHLEIAHSEVDGVRYGRTQRVHSDIVDPAAEETVENARSKSGASFEFHRKERLIEEIVQSADNELSMRGNMLDTESAIADAYSALKGIKPKTKIPKQRSKKNRIDEVANEAASSTRKSEVVPNADLDNLDMDEKLGRHSVF